MESYFCSARHVSNIKKRLAGWVSGSQTTVARRVTASSWGGFQDGVGSLLASMQPSLKHGATPHTKKSPPQFAQNTPPHKWVISQFPRTKQHKQLRAVWHPTSPPPPPAPPPPRRQVRRPVGVVASIVPFNFPAMVPLWQLGAVLTKGEHHRLRFFLQLFLFALKKRKQNGLRVFLFFFLFSFFFGCVFFFFPLWVKERSRAFCFLGSHLVEVPG